MFLLHGWSDRMPFIYLDRSKYIANDLTKEMYLKARIKRVYQWLGINSRVIVVVFMLE